MKVGDKVRIVAPHPEAGAIGVVEKILRANSDYRTRVKVRFSEPYPGAQNVDRDLLALTEVTR